MATIRSVRAGGRSPSSLVWARLIHQTFPCTAGMHRHSSRANARRDALRKLRGAGARSRVLARERHALADAVTDRLARDHPLRPARAPRAFTWPPMSCADGRTRVHCAPGTGDVSARAGAPDGSHTRAAHSPFNTMQQETGSFLRSADRWGGSASTRAAIAVVLNLPAYRQQLRNVATSEKLIPIEGESIPREFVQPMIDRKSVV